MVPYTHGTNQTCISLPSQEKKLSNGFCIPLQSTKILLLIDLLSPTQGLGCSLFFFSTGCFLPPINLISSLSGPAPYLPSIHLPPSYLPFKTKLALVSHHLVTPSPPKLMVGQRKRSQPCKGRGAEVGSVPC